MMSLALNPEVVENDDRDDARANLFVLLREAGFGQDDVIVLEPNQPDHSGLYRFSVQSGDRVCVVEMPGRPIDEVRYTGEGQSIRGFPRLYLNGSGWVWLFAVSQLRSELRPRRVDHD